jgi:PAS domain S-box-containing protein
MMECDETEEYLRSILSYSDDVIFSSDSDGRLVTFSKGAEKVLGYSPDALADTRISDLAVDPREFENLLEAVEEEGNAECEELALRRKDGGTVLCSVYLVKLTDGAGRLKGIAGICQDLTESKSLQENLIKIDRLAEIGRLASGVAHDINNPLANIGEIAGWMGMILSDEPLAAEDLDELKTAVRRIGEQTRRASTITRQLLVFARGSPPAMEAFDMHALLKKTVGFLKSEIKSRPIEVIFDFEDESLPIESDPRLLEQVFVNLIANAIHAVRDKGDEKGLVELKTSVVGLHMEIIIADNGTGIKEEDQGKIFDLFYTTKPPGKGTGLGIPICQNIVKRLGGDISLESSLGAGTTVTVRIPV